MAWISLSKVLVLIAGTVYLLARHMRGQHDPAFHALWTPRILIMILAAFVSSLLWTGADMHLALNSLAKHIKIIEIALLVVLIRNVWEARIAISAFVLGQGILLISSWALFAGLSIPWQANSSGKYVVFSTYLDQSIMFATSATVFWCLRFEKLWPRWMGACLTVLALVNTLLLLEGRTGYVVALMVISLAVMWSMPRHLRIGTLVVTPIALLLLLLLSSNQVNDRVVKIFHEARNFTQTQTVAASDSSGWRLNAWTRSLQAVHERPFHGHGVGNWTSVIKRIEGNDAEEIFGNGNHSNPHQEYLLWMVELGVGGGLLLFALFLGIARDALYFPPYIQQALIGVLAATAVACMFNSALYDDLMGDYFCVCLGLLLSLGARSMVLPTKCQKPV